MSEQRTVLDRSDWTKLTNLSAKIADAVLVEGDELLAGKSIKELLALIDSLLHKYGKLPSLLAIKADFIDNSGERLALYEKAYVMAEKDHDFLNMKMILESIEEMKEGCLLVYKENWKPRRANLCKSGGVGLCI